MLCAVTSQQPPWPVDAHGQPVARLPNGAPDLASANWPHAEGVWAPVGSDGRPVTFGSPAVPAPATSEAKGAAITLLVGGGLSFVGSFMTWASVETGFGTLSVSGTTGGRDGNLTLFLGLLLAAVGLRRLVKKRLGTWGLVGAFVFAIAILGVGIYDTADVSRLSDSDVSVSPGIGLILQIIAGGVGIAGAVMATRERSRT